MVAVLVVISSPTRVTDVISTTDIQDYLSIYVVKTCALQSDTGVAILADISAEITSAVVKAYQ
ncbi:MAG: hypothetical protein CMF43_03545 [Legionellales bacterium]|nr:hypothetical protein [Legionellales bacterium]